MTPEKSYNYCESVRCLKDNVEGAFLELGKMLLKVRDEQLWKGQWTDFEEYLDDIRMSRVVASKLINTFQKFVVDWGIDEKRIVKLGGWTNAYDLASLASDKEEAEALMDEVEDLSPSDRRIKLREKRTGVKEEDCKHEDVYTIEVCEHCGRRIKVYDDTTQE